DVHALLADAAGGSRLAANGRSGAFVDIAASVNRLLDRRDEERTEALGEEPGLFGALTATLPDVALVHTDTILLANRAASELFGVEPETLAGKQVTDLVRPAYRALLRKHVSESLGAAEPPAPVEVQLISGDDRVLWAELYSSTVTYQGQPALLTVARD